MPGEFREEVPGRQEAQGNDRSGENIPATADGKKQKVGVFGVYEKDTGIRGGDYKMKKENLVME